MLNYTPTYEVLCSSNATWQHQGTEAVSGGLEDPAGWLGKAAGGRWASSNGQRAWKWAGFICEMFLDYFFYLSVPNPNFRWKTCINVLTVLRLHLCREDKIVPPADPSPSIQSKPRFWGCCRNIYSLPWALFSPCTPPSGSF